MKRAAPYLLFGLLTVACFWRVLKEDTLYDMKTLEDYLGLKSTETPGWCESNRPPVNRGDTLLSLMMLHRIYNDGLHRGELRLWNPNLFCGAPLYNNLLIHPFYPPNLLLHSVEHEPFAYDINLFLHFFFSGVAMFHLLRGLGRSDVAASAGGLLWMLIGYNSFWFSTGTVMGASVFAPLALLGIHLGLARRDYKPLALGGLCMGLVILGSHGQHALHLLIFFSLWLVVSWIRNRDARPFILKGSALFILGALGVGMAAILTQLDSVLNGLRLPGEDAQIHYAAPWKLVTLMANVAVGKVCYAGDGLLRSEFTIYAGVAGTVMAILGALRGFRDPWTRYLTIFAVTALLVAFVKPLAELALLIPFLNLSMPARWVYVFGFCLTLLAADGLDAMIAEPARFRRPALLAGGACLVLLGCFAPKGAVIETLVGLALAAAWILTAPVRPRLSLAFCFLALTVDLLPNFILHNRHCDTGPWLQGILSLEGLKATQPSVPTLNPSRATGSIRLEGGPVSENVWTNSIGHNLLGLFGVEALMGYESIAPLAAVRYGYAMGGPGFIAGSGRVLAVPNRESRLLDIANTRYLYLAFGAEPGPRFRKITGMGPMTLYENTAALPRAYLASKAVAADDSEGAKLLESPAFDPRTTVVIHDTNELPRVAEGGGAVTWTTYEPGHIELAIEAKADSILVVSDTHYPGWEAELDGKEVPILRANLAFRAVAVPAGTHRLTMHFRPSSARNGLIVTALSIVGILAYAGRRKKPAV